MAHNRRTFLSTTLLASAGLASALRPSSLKAEYSALPMRGLVVHDDLVLPPSLAKGSVVAITAPASGIRASELSDGIRFLEAQGMKVVLGKCISPSLHYLSAPDNQRADEFNEFIQRDDVDAILCARGGYGVARILPLIDYEAARLKAKVIMGYSDITALLIAVFQKSKVITYHGPVCSSTFDATTKSSFVNVMMNNTPQAKDEEPSDTLMYKSDALEVLHDGEAEAELVGGNLSTICSTLGTPYEIDTRNKILFLEEVAEEPYKIDRMITQLWLSGKLDVVKGIVLGIFKNCEVIRRHPSNALNDSMSRSLKDVFAQRFSTMTVPVLAGLPFGHIKSKLTLPLGVKARMDCSQKSLSLVEASVA